LSLAFSLVLTEDTASECFCCLAATAPAPNSRGPHLSVLGRRLSPLPVTSFFQTSLPSLEPKTSRRASFRMPSDETLRFTLVCKLPLLHFSLFPVAVVQLTRFRVNTSPCSCHSQILRRKSFRPALAVSLAVPPPLLACTSTRVDA
jgi:hypothetical protein